jgi:hypothetical protein
MSCCGRGRTTPGGGVGGLRGESRSGPAARTVYFRYLGGSQLSAFGPISGRSYRFGAPGAVLPVDPRDGPSLDRVPKLERVGGPDRTPRRRYSARGNR